MTAKPCWSAAADPERNLIQVSYLGRVDPAGMAECAAKILTLLPGLRPGFTVLTDLSGLEAMELDCVTPLTRMMDQFRARGVATVVRVIPDPARDIGLNILALTHYRGGVAVLTCTTRAEAEQRLPPKP